MIDKNQIKTLVEEWLQGNDYFLVDVNISSDCRIVVEICADGIGVDGHAQAVGLGAELFGVLHLLLVGGGGEVDELNGLKAHIVGLLNDVEVGELARIDVLLEGVGADGDLHGLAFLS